jgi:hypothetical protein
MPLVFVAYRYLTEATIPGSRYSLFHAFSIVVIKTWRIWIWNSNIHSYVAYYFVFIVMHFAKSRDSSDSITMSYGLDGRGSIPGRGKIFLYSVESRSALGPTQPPIQWVSAALSPGAKRRGRGAAELTTHLHIFQRSGMRSLPHTSLWSGA